MHRILLSKSLYEKSLTYNVKCMNCSRVKNIHFRGYFLFDKYTNVYFNYKAGYYSYTVLYSVLNACTGISIIPEYMTFLFFNLSL